VRWLATAFVETRRPAAKRPRRGLPRNSQWSRRVPVLMDY